MKTKSLWGQPPKRLYKFIDIIEENIGRYADIGIIGCSDGKFVLPFLRKGYKVTAFDFDKVALYGGEKTIPINRDKIDKKKYKSMTRKPEYELIPTEKIFIQGLESRAILEGVRENLKIYEKDFYRSEVNEKFDAIFTSCSIQYKSNRDISVDNIMNIIKSHIKVGGYLYMDYMMPLEDSHHWKSTHFFRTGEIKKYFLDDWEIISLKEMKNPIFEAAHIDRPEDHFHRFGYILVRRIK